MKEIINKFEEKRKTSPLCRLSLNNSIIPWDRLNSDSNYPFAFIAYLDNELNKIDALLTKYNIERDGTADFKARFNDRYSIEGDYEKELKYLNASLSALAELVVADYLSKHNENIIQLSACSECASDICSRNGEFEYYTEVKYIGEIPELYSLNHDIIKSGNRVGARWIGSISDIYNYVNIRIADAVFQLEGKGIDIKKRRVFIVIKMSAATMNILPSIIKRDNWRDLSWNSLTKKLNLSDEQVTKYQSDTVEGYRRKCGNLVVGLINGFCDLDVNVI